MDHQYHETPPPPELAPFVQCFWTETTSDRPGEPPMRILPDGCVDIVWRAGSLPVVVGPMVQQSHPTFSSGSTLVGARFHAGMAPVALDLPASALVNEEAPLIDLWGRAGGRSPAGFDHSGAPDDGFAGLATLVRERLARGRTGDPLVTAAARWLTHHPDGPLDPLHERSGLSERQLRRRFEAAIGYGPKTFQRIVRFRAWLDLAASTPADERVLADLAVAAGYADQSHLTREVTRLAGLPPAALLATPEYA